MIVRWNLTMLVPGGVLVVFLAGAFAADADRTAPPAADPVQPVIDAVEKACLERTVFMIGRVKAERLAGLVRQAKPKLVVECGTAIGSNYHPCLVAVEKKLSPGATVVADNVGLGAGAMDDYLKLVRGKYQSRTEWFDVKLPWGERDAMEVTVIARPKP